MHCFFVVSLLNRPNFSGNVFVLFYLTRNPIGSIKVVDLNNEVVLQSLQPLDSQTCIGHPGNSGQVVFTVGKKNPKT